MGQQQLTEIKAIPTAFSRFVAKNSPLTLPTKIPYLGMGASYYAPLTAHHAGAQIEPLIASEYHYYSEKHDQQAVLISQSGESTEVIWMFDHFNSCTVITNNADSTLAKHEKAAHVVALQAGAESGVSSKTWINTLAALYLGHGLSLEGVEKTYQKRFRRWELVGAKLGKQINKYLAEHTIKGLFVIGSGPNLGSAGELSLVLTESTKRAWLSMSVSQFDHGPKEAANDTVVIVCDGQGKDRSRLKLVLKTLKQRTNALVIVLGPDGLDEIKSPFAIVPQGYFLLYFLTEAMNVGATYQIGGKVTTL